MRFHINKGNSIFSESDIKKIEKLKNAVYVSDLCCKTRNDTWSEFPCAVFYVEKPTDPAHSNYFGLFHNYQGELIICNAKSAIVTMTGTIAKNGEVIYSRFRHDHRWTVDETAMIDGGRDYCKFAGFHIELEIVGAEIRVAGIADDMTGWYVQIVPFKEETQDWLKTSLKGRYFYYYGLTIIENKDEAALFKMFWS